MATHVLERRGSSKDIWKTLGDKGEVTGVYFIFSDRVSVFDVGPLPVLFPGLGQLRCAIAGRMFQALNNAGFNTHYLSHDVSSARTCVKPVNIPALNIDYGEAAVGTMLPVELLSRRMITKKFFGRIKTGRRKKGEVSQFEKLLEDVAASDRDSIMTQTYLTSDTGKVYTMLAHASGRIR